MNDKEKGAIYPIFLLGCLFILVYGLALLITKPYESAGISAFENPEDPSNVAYLFLTMTFFTIVMLLIAKFW